MMNIDLRNCLLSNFCKLIPVCLDGSNYVNWKFMLETMLRGCGLMKYIDGSFPCPPQYIITGENEITSEMTAEYISWKQNDYAVMTLLAATLSNDVLSFVVGSNSSKELWFLLKERYASTSWFNKQQLKTNFYKLKKGSDSVDKYLDRVKIACDQLANVGIHMSDEDITDSVLLGLPSEFATMKTIIRVKPSPISIQELRSLLLIAEAELEETNKSISAPVSLSLSPLAAMVAQHNHVKSSHEMQYGTSNAGTPLIGLFPSPYVAFNVRKASTDSQGMPSFSISNGAPQLMPTSRFGMSNGSFNGCSLLQSQVYNPSYGDGYFQQNGNFSRHQNSGLQQNNGRQSQGQTQHVNFRKESTKPKGVVPQHNVGSYHKARNSDSDSTLEDSSKTLGELVAETAEASSGSGMKYGECKVRKSAKAQFHGVRDKKLQKEASCTEVMSHIVSSSSTLVGQVQAGDFMQPSHSSSAILQQRPGMQNFYGIGVSSGGQSCNGPQQMHENGGVFYQQKNGVKKMMNCRQHYQPLQLCPSLPLIPPG